MYSSYGRYKRKRDDDDIYGPNFEDEESYYKYKNDNRRFKYDSRYTNFDYEKRSAGLKSEPSFTKDYFNSENNYSFDANNPNMYRKNSTYNKKPPNFYEPDARYFAPRYRFNRNDTYRTSRGRGGFGVNPRKNYQSSATNFPEKKSFATQPNKNLKDVKVQNVRLGSFSKASSSDSDGVSKTPASVNKSDKKSDSIIDNATVETKNDSAITIDKLNKMEDKLSCDTVSKTEEVVDSTLKKPCDVIVDLPEEIENKSDIESNGSVDLTVVDMDVCRDEDEIEEVHNEKTKNLSVVPETAKFLHNERCAANSDTDFISKFDIDTKASYLFDYTSRSKSENNILTPSTKNDDKCSESVSAKSDLKTMFSQKVSVCLEKLNLSQLELKNDKSSCIPSPEGDNCENVPSKSSLIEDIPGNEVDNCESRKKIVILENVQIKPASCKRLKKDEGLKSDEPDKKIKKLEDGTKLNSKEEKQDRHLGDSLSLKNTEASDNNEQIISSHDKQPEFPKSEAKITLKEKTLQKSEKNTIMTFSETKIPKEGVNTALDIITPTNEKSDKKFEEVLPLNDKQEKSDHISNIRSNTSENNQQDVNKKAEKIKCLSIDSLEKEKLENKTDQIITSSNDNLKGNLNKIGIPERTDGESNKIEKNTDSIDKSDTLKNLLSFRRLSRKNQEAKFKTRPVEQRRRSVDLGVIGRVGHDQKDTRETNKRSQSACRRHVLAEDFVTHVAKLKKKSENKKLHQKRSLIKPTPIRLLEVIGSLENDPRRRKTAKTSRLLTKDEFIENVASKGLSELTDYKFNFEMKTSKKYDKIQYTPMQTVDLIMIPLQNYADEPRISATSSTVAENAAKSPNSSGHVQKSSSKIKEDKKPTSLKKVYKRIKSVGHESPRNYQKLEKTFDQSSTSSNPKKSEIKLSENKIKIQKNISTTSGKIKTALTVNKKSAKKSISLDKKDVKCKKNKSEDGKKSTHKIKTSDSGKSSTKKNDNKVSDKNSDIKKYFKNVDDKFISSHISDDSGKYSSTNNDKKVPDESSSIKKYFKNVDDKFISLHIGDVTVLMSESGKHKKVLKEKVDTITDEHWIEVDVFNPSTPLEGKAVASYYQGANKHQDTYFVLHAIYDPKDAVIVKQKRRTEVTNLRQFLKEFTVDKDTSSVQVSGKTTSLPTTLNSFDQTGTVQINNQFIIVPTHNSFVLASKDNKSVVAPAQSQSVVAPAQSQSVVVTAQSQSVVVPNQSQSVIVSIQNQSVVPDQNRPIVIPSAKHSDASHNLSSTYPSENLSASCQAKNLPVLCSVLNKTVTHPVVNQKAICPDSNPTVTYPSENPTVSRPVEPVFLSRATPHQAEKQSVAQTTNHQAVNQTAVTYPSQNPSVPPHQTVTYPVPKHTYHHYPMQNQSVNNGADNLPIRLSMVTYKSAVSVLGPIFCRFLVSYRSEKLILLNMRENMSLHLASKDTIVEDWNLLKQSFFSIYKSISFAIVNYLSTIYIENFQITLFLNEMVSYLSNLGCENVLEPCVVLHFFELLNPLKPFKSGTFLFHFWNHINFFAQRVVAVRQNLNANAPQNNNTSYAQNPHNNNVPTYHQNPHITRPTQNVISHNNNLPNNQNLHIQRPTQNISHNNVPTYHLNTQVQRPNQYNGNVPNNCFQSYSHNNTAMEHRQNHPANRPSTNLPNLYPFNYNNNNCAQGQQPNVYSSQNTYQYQSHSMNPNVRVSEQTYQMSRNKQHEQQPQRSNEQICVNLSEADWLKRNNYNYSIQINSNLNVAQTETERSNLPPAPKEIKRRKRRNGKNQPAPQENIPPTVRQLPEEVPASYNIFQGSNQPVNHQPPPPPYHPPYIPTTVVSNPSHMPVSTPILNNHVTDVSRSSVPEQFHQRFPYTSQNASQNASILSNSHSIAHLLSTRLNNRNVSCSSATNVPISSEVATNSSSGHSFTGGGIISNSSQVPVSSAILSSSNGNNRYVDNFKIRLTRQPSPNLVVDVPPQNEAPSTPVTIPEPSASVEAPAVPPSSIVVKNESEEEDDVIVVNTDNSDVVVIDATTTDVHKPEFVSIEDWFQKNQKHIETIDLEEYDDLFEAVDCKLDVKYKTEVVEFIGTEEVPPRFPSADSGISIPLMEEQNNCFCGAKADFVCSCRDAVYCSRRCQEVDWESHQKTCKSHQK